MTDPLTVLQGDALEQLRTLPECSIQCCVTSPPYWGLRDYGTASWQGGDGDCDHSVKLGGNGDASAIQVGNRWTQTYQARSDCPKCGAKRIDSQIGLEETPEQYVVKIVEVFREVRRVLKNNGTLWINMGDSYWNGGAQKRDGGHDFVDGGKPKLLAAKGSILQPKLAPVEGWKPKDLCGIPWRVAFALQADGWYLRSDIIWSKPNPMPESVTDRPTKAHEYLFLLSKSERYFYDAEAISEPITEAPHAPRNLSSGRIGTNGKTDNCVHQNDRIWGESGVRNKRSVWTVSTAPYAEAHFATYPPDLIKPCILAGTKAGDTVLDPFAGSGTTGMVALELGRQALLVELNPGYIALIEKRCAVTLGLPL
jgi:DNA modification methylase